MVIKSKKRAIKLINKFEVYFFKNKYYIVGFLLLFLLILDNEFVLSLDDRNSLILWSGLCATVIIFIIVFFFMPTYRKVYTIERVWGTSFIFMVIFAMSLSNLLLRINGSMGVQKPMEIDVIVIKTCKSHYRRHYKYNAIVNTSAYGKMNLSISEKSYNKMKKGSTFHQTWYEGSLGIVYWKS